jgi:hypothetical protein
VIRAVKHLLDDADRKILEFKSNIRRIREAFLNQGAINIEVMLFRIEERVNTLACRGCCRCGIEGHFRESEPSGGEDAGSSKEIKQSDAL